MNVFELSAIATPLAAAIAGGSAVKTPGIGSLTLGVAVGLALGLAFYFAAIGISFFWVRFCAAEKLNPLQWFVSLVAVLMPATSPLVAWPLTVFVVSEMIHL